MKQILTLMVLFALCLLAKNLAYCAIILFIFVLPIFKILKNNKLYKNDTFKKYKNYLK